MVGTWKYSLDFSTVMLTAGKEKKTFRNFLYEIARIKMCCGKQNFEPEGGTSGSLFTFIICISSIQEASCRKYH